MSLLNNQTHPPAESAVDIDDAQLMFEPAISGNNNHPWVLYSDGRFQERDESEQYPNVVYIPTPSDAETCVVSVIVATSLPDWSDAQHVCAFPLRVEANPQDEDSSARVGTLFPKSLFAAAEDKGFDVPPGEYDTLARFYSSHTPTDDNNEEDDEEDWDDDVSYRVFVSLMPRGTLAPGILKSLWNRT